MIKTEVHVAVRGYQDTRSPSPARIQFKILLCTHSLVGCAMQDIYGPVAYHPPFRCTAVGSTQKKTQPCSALIIPILLRK